MDQDPRPFQHGHPEGQSPVPHRVSSKTQPQMLKCVFSWIKSRSEIHRWGNTDPYKCVWQKTDETLLLWSSFNTTIVRTHFCFNCPFITFLHIKQPLQKAQKNSFHYISESVELYQFTSFLSPHVDSRISVSCFHSTFSKMIERIQCPPPYQ